MPVTAPTILSLDDTGIPGDNISSVQVNIRLTGSSPEFANEWRAAIDLGADGLDNDADGVIDEAGENIHLLDTVSYVADQITGTFSIGVNLAAGTHNILFINPVIVGSDGVSATSPIVVTPDSTQPNLAANDDTGSSNSDNLTNRLNGLTFTGSTSTAGQTVQLFDFTDNAAKGADGIDNNNNGQVDEANEGAPGLVLLGTTVTNASGGWSVDTSLSEGAHKIVASVNGGPITLFTEVTVDRTAPQLSNAKVQSDGSILINASEMLQGAFEAGDFTVMVNGLPVSILTVTGVTMNPGQSGLLLTLVDPIERHETVTLAYNASAGVANSVRDLAGNAAASFAALPVFNQSQVDTTPPVMEFAETAGSIVYIKWSEAVIGDDVSGSLEAGDFTVTVDGVVIPVLSATVPDGSLLPFPLRYPVGTVALHLASPIGQFTTATVAYQSAAGTPDTIKDIDVLGDANLPAQSHVIAISPNVPPAFLETEITYTLTEDTVSATSSSPSYSFNVQFSDTGTYDLLHFTPTRTFVGITLTLANGSSASFDFPAGASPDVDFPFESRHPVYPIDAGLFGLNFDMFGVYQALTQFMSAGDRMTIAFDVTISDTAGSDTLRMNFVIEGANEVFNGNSLDNSIVSSEFADNVNSMDGDDTISARGGNDNIIGGSGDDTADGGSGNDVMYGGLGDDRLIGGSGNDTIAGGIDSDVLSGGSGDDRLVGNEGSDDLRGGSGNDTLQGGVGFDTMRGGEGNDTYLVDVDESILEYANSGTDTVRAGFSYVLDQNVENLVLLGVGTINGTGNILGNVITGNSGLNTLNGMAGNDTLSGGIGADVLIGGLGADSFRFDLISSSRNANGIDTIQDFSFAAGDRIDISLVDADATQIGDQAFTTLIASNLAFSAAGQYRLTAISGGFRIAFNTNSSAAAEMSINVLTSDPSSTASDWLIA